jgi:hypothetical protein
VNKVAGYCRFCSLPWRQSRRLASYLLIAPDLPENLGARSAAGPAEGVQPGSETIGLFGEMRRIPVTLDEVPAELKNAFIAGEDARFYEHPGVDYQGISRAAFTLLTTGENQRDLLPLPRKRLTCKIKKYSPCARKNPARMKS